ncbi:MAG: methyltransferase domain-containing protein [Pseudomarimonas sp.]
MNAGTEDQLAIRAYYGQTLSRSSDLKTSACCPTEAMPAHLRPLLVDIHPDISARFYGCGSPLPSVLAGCTVLDLGCGTGRDAYLLSRLVGEHGRVIGVDMTPEQLEVARRHRDWHARRYGYAASNVELHEGMIEDLGALGITDASVDVVVSNCVLNLATDKASVFAEIFRVLKPGGELYFSDVFADRRIPAHLRHDPVLLGECLAGAMYGEDFRRVLNPLGCADARCLSSTPIMIDDPAIVAKIGMVNFTSRTIRAFKLELEDRCEDHGQVATYLGSIAEHPHAFVLDDHHRLETGRPMLVCGNTAAMLGATRYGQHFQISGDTRQHFGLFDCAPPTAPDSTAACC